MAKIPKRKEIGLQEVIEGIISQLQEKYPQTKILINGETYGEEDIDIDIFAPRDELIEIDRFACEITFKVWEETGHDILPMIAPMECCPIK